MRWKPLVGLILTLATVLLYWQVGQHGFLNYDDDVYVTANPFVRAGLTRDSIAWAFSAIHEANWHPLAWISHMVDCQLFGLDPRGHHLTSLVLHTFNGLLLLLLLNRMTGMLWQSAMVAALFAIHPLHVESVAWVAERKDVLSAMFWLLALYVYAGYARHPSWRSYLATLLLFALGLMAKPMVVTLPFVLLLLDRWPLQRRAAGCSFVRLLSEKIPFFALSLGSAIITIIAQRSDGALVPAEALPLLPRLANALVAYVSYLGKMLWPERLGVLYLYSPAVPLWQAGGALLLLLAISVLVLRTLRSRPYLAVGWFWYLGTLVPVIGIVQVGHQAMADRYTYLPLIGPFIMLAWGIPELLSRVRWRSEILAPLAGGALLALALCTWQQLGYWRNSVTLFTRTLEVSPDNFVAEMNLGNALVEEGRFPEAVSHLTRAVALKPVSAEAHYNLGNALVRQGRNGAAVDAFTRALWINPDYALAHNNLGSAYERLGKPVDALHHYREALRIDPGDGIARQNLENVLRSLGK
jgi:tetratricopeptide (TPR) repeat protein